MEWLLVVITKMRRNEACKAFCSSGISTQENAQLLMPRGQMYSVCAAFSIRATAGFRSSRIAAADPSSGHP